MHLVLLLLCLSNFDLDGIPTPLLQKKLKKWSDVDFNGDGDEKYYINIFDDLCAFFNLMILVFNTNLN